MFVPECRIPGCELLLPKHVSGLVGSLVGLPVGSFFSGWGQCSGELGCTESNLDSVHLFMVNLGLLTFWGGWYDAVIQEARRYVTSRMFLALTPLKEEFKPGWVLLVSILEALLFSSACLRPAVLISKGPWTGISPWQLLDQDGQIMAVPGLSSWWTNGQMVVWTFLPEVSYVVCKQNKWLYVFNLISLLFNGVYLLCQAHSLGCGWMWSWTGSDHRFDIGIFFLWLHEAICILFILDVYFNKGKSEGMEGVGEGSVLLISVYFLSTRFMVWTNIWFMFGCYF